MRTFLAFEIPPEIKKMCIDVQKKLEKYFRNDVIVKWVEPDNLHVTLLFLGEVRNQQLKELIARLETINDRSFLLNVDRLNWDGRNRIPRVLWVSLKNNVDSGKTVDMLYLNVKKILKSLNVEVEDRDYIPHITLGRVKKVKKRVVCEVPRLFGSFEVDRIHVMSSELTSKGPFYNLIKTIRLKHFYKTSEILTK